MISSLPSHSRSLRKRYSSAPTLPTTGIYRHPIVDAARPPRAQSVGRDGDRVAIGTGDSDINSGPIDMALLDSKGNASVGLRVMTECLHVARYDHNGATYFPWEDPRPHFDIGGYTTNVSGEWVNHESVPGMVHTLDILVQENGHMWLSGTGIVDGSQHATVYHSVDNGRTWSLSLRRSGTGWFQGLSEVDGKIYVGGAGNYVYDGQSWSDTGSAVWDELLSITRGSVRTLSGAYWTATGVFYGGRSWRAPSDGSALVRPLAEYNGLMLSSRWTTYNGVEATEILSAPATPTGPVEWERYGYVYGAHLNVGTVLNGNLVAGHQTGGIGFYQLP